MTRVLVVEDEESYSEALSYMLRKEGYEVAVAATGPDALAEFTPHRPGETPVAVVEEADRPDQKVTLSTLADFDPAVVNMNSLVVVGSSTTRYLPAGEGRTVMVTPRDYHWMKP